MAKLPPQAEMLRPDEPERPAGEERAGAFSEAAPDAADRYIPGVKKVLLTGVFWRILAIEAILLIGSLAARAWLQESSGWDLFWYAMRIILLVAVIILFMWLTLSAFLRKKIIRPLEAIALANRRLQSNDPSGREVSLPADVPREIREIASSRQGMLAAITRIAEQRLRLVEFIKKTFGRYLSDKVVEEILSSPQGASLGGRRQQVTVLMSDLRGFTTLAASRDPEEMVTLLNQYLARMSGIIITHDGVIDEFIGDAILAVFGAPEPRRDDALRAVACAVEMQVALAALNRDLGEALEMGVAVNSGQVLLGNIGSEVRMKYGVVGDPVNLASRLESTTVGGQVIIGQTTYEMVKEMVTTTPAQTHLMKGFKQPLVGHPVLAVGPPYDLRLPASEALEEMTPMELPLSAWLVSGKEVMAGKLSGTSLALGDGILEVSLPEKLAPGSDLKLNLELCVDAHCFGDIYAKVLDVREHPQGHTLLLRLTGLSDADRRMLRRWREQAG